MEAELPTEYDVIVVGTGLLECIIAAASARVGKKVLHIDKNDYYGGQWASFTLQGIEQWVTDITTSKEQEKQSETESCALEEGESILETCDPRRGYSNVKQSWYIKKEDDPPVTPSENVPETPSASEEEKVQETETSTGTSHEESEPEKKYEIEPSSNKDIAPPVEDKKKPSCSQQTLLKLSRKFNLDLAPKLLFSRGALVELLISSNVARYAEFKCITRVLTWLASGEDVEEGELLVVPCSRSDVFTTNSVSLVEKRLLMKLLEFCHSYDQNPEQLEEFDNKTFVEFLKSRRQTPNLIHFVTEAIAMVDSTVTCKEGLEKTKLFLTSLGRYGTTPFLFSMYGCGELPQAFCRLCAVFEGTYVLRRHVSSIIMNSSNSCVGLLSEGERFKCSHLVMDAMYAPQQYLSAEISSHKSISRGIFIVSSSILPNEKEQLTLLRLPAKGKNSKPVTILEIGFGSGVCPKDLYCVQMTCEGGNAEEDLKVAVERLFAPEGEECNKPTVLWSLYYNQVDISNVDLVEGIPSNVYLCSGPDTNLDYDSAISQARSLFTRMFPEEEFLPRAPDPDEIVFDNAGAEPKQGDNFSSEESSEKKEHSVNDGTESQENSETCATEKKVDSVSDDIESQEHGESCATEKKVDSVNDDIENQEHSKSHTTEVSDQFNPENVDPSNPVVASS